VTESARTPDEPARIGTADEPRIAPRRANTTLRRPLPIWVVRVGDELYVRSWRGDDGSWYRAAQTSGEGHISAGGVERDIAYVPAGEEVNDAVDDAYRQKYRRHTSYIEPRIAPQARATTLRLVPRETVPA
jgi:hypothetical protein